jgi:hypothetical protein
MSHSQGLSNNPYPDPNQPIRGPVMFLNTWFLQCEAVNFTPNPKLEDHS